MLRLEAGDGLALVWREGDLRVLWHGLDWWGPVTAGVGYDREPLRVAGHFEGRDDLGVYTGWRVESDAIDPRIETSVRAYCEEPLLVFRSAARERLGDLATGAFDAPCCAWPRLAPGERERAGWPADAAVYGHQYTEFALPTFSDADCASFFLLPGRPAVVEPLWLRAAGHVLMLAPLDAFHDQVIAVPRDAAPASRGVRCGWHGDLDAVEAGFASEVALWGGDGVRAAAERWGAALLARHGTRRRGRYADVAVGLLSYWTDNGAAYWYRTEPGHDVQGTLLAALTSLRDARVPVTAVELDSWFYPHATLRAIDDGETEVPPTGALVWEPRPDALPEGVEALRAVLGRPPLILHGRHFSSASPYFERYPAWRDGDRAHPSSPALFDTLMAQARRWGAVQYEQDWLVESFLGVRGLRAAPGRARRWQEDLDRAAEKNGLSLLWCMGTPADFFQTVSLRALGAIRTSGDYRYRIGSESLWCWFLYGNALARALGLLPFKDVFVSDPKGDGRDGDPHAELEAALAALSGGPVGLGDRAGHTQRDVVMRTCREDGQLVKPDVPIAALDRCFARHAHLWPDPLLAETWSQHAAGRWVYALGLHASRAYGEIAVELPLRELPLDPAVGAWVAWDWRERTLSRVDADATLRYPLAPRAWRLHVLCPVLPGEIALIGDPTKYATVGDARIHRIDCSDGAITFDALGVAGESVQIEGWAGGDLPVAEHWTPDASGALAVATSETGAGGFRLEVPIAERGWTHVRLVPR